MYYKGKEKMENVRLVFINGIGPVIGILQSENDKEIVLAKAAQIVSSDGEYGFSMYLAGIVDPTSNTIFYKSNVASNNPASEEFKTAYLQAVGEKPMILAPSKDILIPR